MALPIILHESEIWTNKQRIKIIDIIWDEFFFSVEQRDTQFKKKKNNAILEELKAEPVDEKIRSYKSNWLRYVTRMNSSRMAKIMLNYRTN